MVLPLHLHHPRTFKPGNSYIHLCNVNNHSAYLDNLLDGLDGWTADVGGIINPVSQLPYKEALVFP